VLALLVAALVVSPPHLRAAPGWHVGSRRAHACPGVSRARCVQAEAWASTARYRDCPDCVPPVRTLPTLPRDGIVIQVLNAQENPSRMPSARWPPRIVPHPGPFDGVPARFSLYGKSGRTGATEWSLYVWFGRRHPTPVQLARATAELRTSAP
jgi:hypothetical protein